MPLITRYAKMQKIHGLLLEKTLHCLIWTNSPYLTSNFSIPLLCTKRKSHIYQRLCFLLSCPGLYFGATLDISIHSSISSVQFSSVAQSYLTRRPYRLQTLGFPVHYQLPELTQTRVHWVSDAIQPSHPLLSPSPPAPNPSQHQGPFQWVSPSHEVAKILEFQLQHQSFQWTPRTDLL